VTDSARPIDLEDIRDIVKDARQRNLNIPEVLNARGLLLTAEKRGEILCNDARAIAALVAAVTPQQMGIKLPCTAADMQKGIVNYIEKVFGGETE
jgi:hypothetical protein